MIWIVSPQLPDEDVGVIVQRLVDAGGAGEQEQRQEQTRNAVRLRSISSSSPGRLQHRLGRRHRLRQRGGVAPDTRAGDQAADQHDLP